MGLRERRMRKKKPNEVLRRKQFGDENVVAVVEENLSGPRDGRVEPRHGR